MSSYHGSSPTKQNPPLISQHSLSSPNVLEYLTNPPKVSTSAPDLKIKSTILPGRRTRSPSPTPPPYPYPNYFNPAIKTSLNPSNSNPAISNLQKTPDTGKYNPGLWSGGTNPIMSSYLGDCVKYPTNRNYGSNINRQGTGPGIPIPPSPRRAQRPTCLIPDSNWCLSCPPQRLNFSEAMQAKQQDPEIPGEVRWMGL